MRVRSPGKRAGVSSVPQITADGTGVVVGAAFPVRLHRRRQGDQDRVDDRRTHPGISAKSGGALDHRAPQLVTELESVFAAAGAPPKALRMGNGLELASQAL